MAAMASLMQIGEFSRATGLSLKALRLYDENGLLVPTHVGESGYRRYHPDQLRPARLISALRGAGMSLAEIAVVLAAAPDERPGLLEGHAEALARDLAARRARLADARHLLEEEAMVEVTIRNVEEQRYVGRELRGFAHELDGVIPRTIDELARGVAPAGPPFTL